MQLSSRSAKLLQTVHSDLRRVIERAALLSSDLEFVVTEGIRTAERQKQLYEQGASKTLKSRHLTGHAVDLAVMINKELRWDWPLYYRLADLVKRAAVEENVPIEWGGDWTSFKDGPHFQLPKSIYPE